MPEISDDDLIVSYLTTSQSEAIREIFVRYSDIVYRMAFKMSGNQADAEDAMQNSFIKCIEHLSQYQIGSNFRAWLMRIVINTCKHKFNEEKRRSARELRVSKEKDRIQMDNDTMEEDEELTRTVKKCVSQLPKRYSMPIWLVLCEGFSYQEVAVTLALPEKTVRTQVARGLEKLRGILASMGIAKNTASIAILISKAEPETAPASSLESIRSIADDQRFNQKSSTSKSASNRLSATSLKTTSTASKAALLTLLTSVAIVSSTYLFTITNKKERPTKVVSNQVQTPQVESEIVYTNHIWSFHERESVDIRVLEGSWKWSRQDQGMVIPIDERLAIALPIKEQNKPFVIEADLFSKPTEKNPNLDVYFGIHWEKNTHAPKGEKIIFIKDLKNPLKPKMKIYFYQNYVAIFSGDNLNSLQIYSESLKEAYPVIFCKNFIFRKITSKTLETSPAELLDSIQRHIK